jgi:hypothetical protein
VLGCRFTALAKQWHLFSIPPLEFMAFIFNTSLGIYRIYGIYIQYPSEFIEFIEFMEFIELIFNSS